MGVARSTPAASAPTTTTTTDDHRAARPDPAGRRCGRDDFNGAANTSPSAANWLLRTGTQYPGGAANWGTGSVETASASTANVFLDGAGQLSIRAIRDGAGNWTSGRIETQRTDFAPAAGELLQVHRGAQAARRRQRRSGYWPGFRATGAAYRGNFNNWPGIGETDIMTDVNGRSQLSQTLHCGTAPDGVVQRVQRPHQRPGLVHRLPDRLPRVHPDHRPDEDRRGGPLLPRRPADLGRPARARSASPPGHAAIHHGFYLRLDLAIGGSLPNAVAGFTTPTADTTSGGVLSVDSVTVARSTGTDARRR